MFDSMDASEAVADQVSLAYFRASQYLNLEMDQIFERYQKKHYLSEKDAYNLLNKVSDSTSLDELKNILKTDLSITNREGILAELEGSAYAARLEHLQHKQEQIDFQMQKLYHLEKDLTTRHYIDLASKGYYKSLFDIQKQAGYAFQFNQLSTTYVQRILNSSWSGSNYSDRIWKNTKKLAQVLKEEMMISILTGRPDKEVSEIITHEFAVGASKSRRLVRTESSFICNEMEAKSYEESGIEKYRFLATLDLKTSKECRKLDGKIYSVAERQVGINYPPIHPWCRSTTICFLSAEDLSRMKRSARDPATGRTVLVPADMTYIEWYDKYVKGNPISELEEKKIKNLSSDKKQYKRYKEILEGSNISEDFDTFQNIKYSDLRKYGIIKSKVKGMGYYEKALKEEPNITKCIKSVAEKSGMRINGFEYRIKSKESFLRKVESEFKLDGNQYVVGDIIRYTYTALPKDLYVKIGLSIALLREEGYNIIKLKNYWLDKRNPYNGINVTLRSPTGQRFELQYHTNESYLIKDFMHKKYELWRSLDPGSEQAVKVRKEMFMQSEGMEVPQKIYEVENEP